MVQQLDDWLSLSIARKSDGLYIAAKVAPEVEAFMAALAGDMGSPLELAGNFGRRWTAVNGGTILVYRQETTSTFNVPTISLDGIGESLLSIGKSFNVVNLSWLRFVGIGKPEGVKFRVSGVYDHGFVKRFSEIVGVQARDLFRNYIAPVNIVLRISAKEV